MSKFVNGTLVLKDEESLILALKNVFGEDSVEVNEEPKNLYGYNGDEREEVAHIIVHRKHMNRVSGGSSNDLGFKREDNGTLSMIVSEYDTSKKIRDRVQQAYAENVILRSIRKQSIQNRLRITSRRVDKDGQLILRIGRRTTL